MEKLLTIIIPTYNTEQYLSRCIDSLLIADFMDKLEIIIIIDGSPDNSAKIGYRYEARYPQTIQVVDKPNGGHGSTINKGIELATGKYFRVLDSDDWFDTMEFEAYLKKLEETDADMVLTPSTMEYLYKHRSVALKFKRLQYDTLYNADTFDYNHFIGDKFNTMARTTYKTEVLRASKLKLPEHTYYVDVLYSLCVIPYIQNFIVYNNNIYRYFIGRPEQSINNYTRHIKDLRTVICICLDFLCQSEGRINKNKADYLNKEVRMRITQFALICFLRLPLQQVVSEIDMLQKQILQLPEKNQKQFAKNLRTFKLYKKLPLLYAFYYKIHIRIKNIFNI